MTKLKSVKKISVYTDGGSRGNPGPGAVGIVVCNIHGEKIKEYSEYLGKVTNNEAEYGAVIFALKKIKHLFGKKSTKNMEVEINSDSELLVNQLEGEYKIVNSKIGELFLKVWNLKIDYKKVKFNLIPREKNRKADALVNQCLDAESKAQGLF